MSTVDTMCEMSGTSRNSAAAPSDSDASATALAESAGAAMIGIDAASCESHRVSVVWSETSECERQEAAMVVRTLP